MTDKTATSAKANLAPLHPTALAGGAWRNVRDNFASLWPLWAIWSVYSVGQAYGEHYVSTTEGRASLAGLGYLAIISTVGAFLSGLATRGLLGGSRAWWTPDARLGRFVILMGVGNLLINAPYLFSSANESQPRAAGAGGLLLLSLLQLIVLIVVLWAAVRLLLWPIGQLDEGGLMTARQSWRRMRGAFWPYFGASILAGLGPTLVVLVLLFQYQQRGALWGLFAQAPFTGLMGLIFAAVTVEIYRTRVSGPGTLAKVFD